MNKCKFNINVFIVCVNLLYHISLPCKRQVCVEGRLYLEFMFDDMMRIKTWHFSIRQHRELIPRSILAMHVCVRPSANSMKFSQRHPSNCKNIITLIFKDCLIYPMSAVPGSGPADGGPAV